MSLIEKYLPDLPYLDMSSLTSEQERDLTSALHSKEHGANIVIHLHDGKLSGVDYKNEKGFYDRNPNNGPAVKAWYPDGQLAVVSYYTSDMLHREPTHGPATSSWHPNGQRAEVKFSLDGKEHLHYLVGPARREWNDEGVLLREEYFWKGQRHRDPKCGPAFIRETYDFGLYYWRGQAVDEHFVPPHARPKPDGLGRLFV